MMRKHLVFEGFRAVGWAVFVVSIVACGAAMVRLLPWVVAVDVPWDVTFAFFLALFPSSMEVAIVVAVPVGCALLASQWVSDGTTHTLATLGVGPMRVVAHLAVVVGVMAALGAAAGGLGAAVARAPGYVTNRMVFEAQASACDGMGLARVPGLDVAWVCWDATSHRHDAGQPQMSEAYGSLSRARLVGAFPKQGAAVLGWSASQAVFSPRLDDVEMSDLIVSVRGDRDTAAIVSAQRVRITGIGQWLGPGGAGVGARSAMVGLSVLVSSLASAWWLLRWPRASKARALGVAVSSVVFVLLSGPQLSALPMAVAWGAMVVACVVPAAIVARLTFQESLRPRRSNDKSTS